MPVKVVCPNPGCDTTYSISDERLGRKVRCRKCGERFVAEDASVPPTRGSSAFSRSGRSAKTLPMSFGKYRVIRKLGQGGMGEVYLGRDEELARDVALKVPLLNGDDDEDFLSRFRREARAAAAFRHPNFCPIYEVGTQGDRPYLVMAFIEGKPLSEIAGRGRPMEPSAASALVRRVALAMAEAHEKKIVHRDLKPSNVMIDNDGEPIVMDFGLAWVPSADDSVKTVTGRFFGSAHYASPEQIRGDKTEIGPPTDIYSLGAMFYELVTGRRPFEGSAHYALAQVFIADPPPPSSVIPGLDPRFDSVCAKAMSKEISGRYASMREFASDLHRLTMMDEGLSSGAGPPIGAKRPDPPIEPGRAVIAPGSARRIPLRMIAVFTAVAVLAVGGFATYVATDSGTLRIDGFDPTMTLTIDGREVRVTKVGDPIKVRSGEHGLTITRGDQVIPTPKVFEIRRGSESVITLSKADSHEKETPIAARTGHEEAARVVPKGDAKTISNVAKAEVAAPAESVKAIPPAGSPKVALEPVAGAFALINGGKFREASETLDATVLTEPSAKAFALRALSRFFVADTSGAIADADHAIELDPQSAMAYLARGLAYDERGDPTRSAEDLSKASNRDPASPAAPGFLASILSKLNRPDDSKAAAARSLKREAKDDLDRLAHAEANYVMGEAARSRAILDDLIKRCPNYVAYIDRAATYGPDQVATAVADLTSALELAPGSVIARISRAALNLDQNQADSAMSDLEEAIRLVPNHPLAIGLRGRAYLDVQKYDEGHKDLLEAVRLGAREAFIYERLGYSHNRREESNEAIEALNLALAIDPTSDGALYERGVALERKGEHGRAIRDFTSVLATRKDYVNALHWRAIARTETKDFDGSIADYTAVLDQDKENVSALIGRARARNGKMQFQEAIDDATRAIMLDKQNPLAYDYRAIARDAKGESVGAEADREIAKSLRAASPNEPAKD